MCQENESEPQQTMIAVATETQAYRPIEWNHYSRSNRIGYFISHRKRFKKNGALKADNIHQVEQILFRFVQTESFQNDKKL